jgi:hypothetical protein
MSATDLRLQPKMTTADELVLLVRVLPFTEAVKLVEVFARCHEAAGRVDHAVDVYNRVSVGMEGAPHA